MPAQGYRRGPRPCGPSTSPRPSTAIRRGGRGLVERVQPARRTAAARPMSAVPTRTIAASSRRPGRGSVTRWTAMVGWAGGSSPAGAALNTAAVSANPASVNVPRPWRIRFNRSPSPAEDTVSALETASDGRVVQGGCQRAGLESPHKPRVRKRCTGRTRLRRHFFSQYGQCSSTIGGAIEVQLLNETASLPIDGLPVHSCMWYGLAGGGTRFREIDEETLRSDCG